MTMLSVLRDLCISALLESALVVHARTVCYYEQFIRTKQCKKRKKEQHKKQQYTA